MALAWSWLASGSVEYRGPRASPWHPNPSCGCSFSLRQVVSVTPKKKSRALLVRLSVAGFCRFRFKFSVISVTSLFGFRCSFAWFPLQPRIVSTRRAVVSVTFFFAFRYILPFVSGTTFFSFRYSGHPPKQASTHRQCCTHLAQNLC